MTNTPEDKAAFNAKAKASMRQFLQRKSWEEKVQSIARMNAFGKRARESMRNVRLQEAVQSVMLKPDQP